MVKPLIGSNSGEMVNRGIVEGVMGILGIGTSTGNFLPLFDLYNTSVHVFAYLCRVVTGPSYEAPL